MLVTSISGGGGGSITDLQEIYTTTSSNDSLTSHTYTVTSGKTYIVVGTMRATGRTNEYSVTGGDLLDTVYSGNVNWGGNDAVAVILLIKATSSSMSIAITSGGYTTGIYGGTVQELD